MHHVKYGESKQFYLEGIETAFEGWDNGQRWNGWAMPFFTKETRDNIISAMNLDWNSDEQEFLAEVRDLVEAQPNEDGLIQDGGSWCYFWADQYD